MLNHKIERLLSRVPEEHVWYINNLWYPAMNSGGIPYDKPYALNTIRIYVSVFIVHILKYLKSDLSNYLEAVEAAINSCSRDQFSTKKDILFAARSLAKYLLRKKKIHRSVLKEINRIKLKRTQDPKQPVLSIEDVKQIIEYSKSKFYRQPEYNGQLDQVIIWFFFYTGVRVSELSNLSLECLDLTKDRFKIENSKGGKSRFISIHKDLRPHLDAYLCSRPQSQNNNVFLLSDGRPLTVDRLEKRISKICTDAGFNKGLHQFRRGMITHFANKAVPITHLQIVAGHSSFSTTLTYYKPDLEEILAKQVNW